MSDVYRYDKIPLPLLNQVTKTWERFFGGDRYSTGNGSFSNSGWSGLRSDIAEYIGKRTIKQGAHDNMWAVCEWFVEVLDGDVAIDVLDISVNVMLKFNGSEQKRKCWNSQISALDAVEEINTRLREHSIGYEFLSGKAPQMVRKDNQHLHHDVVLPALRLLHDQTFTGANEEYRSSHAHYLHARYEECLTDCLKALESTLKTIIGRRKWGMPEKQTASNLIKECLSKGLLGSFMGQHLGNFQSALESGVPTVRNNLGAHGKGEEVREVPRFYAEYMIHETAVNIVLLVEAFKALPPMT